MATADFLTQYNLLLEMYQGCNSIVKDLDKFSTALGKLLDAGAPIPAYKGNNIFVDYVDIYWSRSNLYIHVTDYLDKYNNNLNNYRNAKDYLINIKVTLNVMVKVPEIENLIGLKNSFIEANYPGKLVVSLRDPLRNDLLLLSQADTDSGKSGGTTTASKAETSNKQAQSVSNVAEGLMQNPVVAKSTEVFTAEDSRQTQIKYLEDKAKNDAKKKDILLKMSNGSYLETLASNATSVGFSWLKPLSNDVEDLNDFIMRTLVLNNPVRVTTTTQSQDDVNKKFRDQIRKKYGGLGFCDEVKDKNGNWILEKDAKAAEDQSNAWNASLKRGLNQIPQ